MGFVRERLASNPTLILLQYDTATIDDTRAQPLRLFLTLSARLVSCMSSCSEMTGSSSTSGGTVFLVRLLLDGVAVRAELGVISIEVQGDAGIP